MLDFSPFQHVHFIGEQRFAIAEKRQDDSEADGGFSGGVSDYKNCEDLAVHVAEHVREGDQVDVHCVQNQFDGHQNDDDIPAREHADHADGEQRETEPKIMIHGNHYTLRFAITTAPIMATRSKIDAISKGSIKWPKSASATASVFFGEMSRTCSGGKSDFCPVFMARNICAPRASATPPATNLWRLNWYCKSDTSRFTSMITKIKRTIMPPT